MCKAVARAVAPAATMLLPTRCNVVREVLVCKAVAMAVAPAAPMMLSLRFNIVRKVLVCKAVARAVVPTSPMLLVFRYNVVRVGSLARIRLTLTAAKVFILNRRSGSKYAVFSPTFTFSFQKGLVLKF